jgi:hypothetical protein
MMVGMVTNTAAAGIMPDAGRTAVSPCGQDEAPAPVGAASFGAVGIATKK